MDNTNTLAREHGLVETISVNKENNLNKQNAYSIQNFQYLLVLEFESTWDRSRKVNYKNKPEITEFPAVLYKIITNEIISEFQQYVLPTENHKLITALYKEFYYTRAQGFKGALNDVGLKFKGREHYGLDDAKNTVYLVGRIIQDSVLIRITNNAKINDYSYLLYFYINKTI